LTIHGKGDAPYIYSVCKKCASRETTNARKLKVQIPKLPTPKVPTGDRLKIVDGKAVKWCSKCGKTKPAELFAESKDAKDGLRNWCKECTNQWAREHNPGKKNQPVVRLDAGLTARIENLEKKMDSMSEQLSALVKLWQ
jgi:hypothetical protein